MFMGTCLPFSVDHAAGPPFPAFPLVLCGHVTCSGPGGQAEVKGTICRPGPRKPPRCRPPRIPCKENGSSEWIWNSASLLERDRCTGQDTGSRLHEPEKKFYCIHQAALAVGHTSSRYLNKYLDR